jgi:hypothetical protein
MIWTQDIPTTPGIYLYKKRKNSKDTAIRSHVAIAEVIETISGWYLGPLSCGECVFWTQTGLLKSGRCKFFPTTSNEPKYRNDWCGQFNNGES